jgi:hypothetical protein
MTLSAGHRAAPMLSGAPVVPTRPAREPAFGAEVERDAVELVRSSAAPE